MGEYSRLGIIFLTSFSVTFFVALAALWIRDKFFDAD